MCNPYVNPFIYSQRNKYIKRALKIFFEKETIKAPSILGI
jgi:hypothetical protein